MSIQSTIVGCQHGLGFKCEICWPHLQVIKGTTPVKKNINPARELASTLAAPAAPTVEDLERKFRKTGRSTRIAVSLVQTALSQPGKPLETMDHHYSREAAKDMCKRVTDILDLMTVPYERTETSVTVKPFDKKEPS